MKDYKRMEKELIEIMTEDELDNEIEELSERMKGLIDRDTAIHIIFRGKGLD